MAAYLRPTRLQQALAALADHPWTVLSGGTDHFPARVVAAPDERVLDISGLPDLRGIARHGDTWRIGALTTWTDLLRTDLPPLFDAMKQAARQVGGRQIQNAGTLAGNLCNASPAADGIPVLLALDARVVLQDAGGERTLPVADFVQGPRRTARRPDELVTALLIPHQDAGSTFLKLGGRAYLVISIAMAALIVGLDERGSVGHAAIAVGACGPRAVRLPALEAALLGHPPGSVAITDAHLAPLAPIDDVRGSAEYRLLAVRELLTRGLAGFAPARAAA